MIQTELIQAALLIDARIAATRNRRNRQYSFSLQSNAYYKLVRIWASIYILMNEETSQWYFDTKERLKKIHGNVR